jgi:phosphohistidine phosphatase
MRHARAEWPRPGSGDFDRPLTAAGVREAKAMGEMMAAGGYLPDTVICSGARRCRETLEALSPLLDTCPVEFLDLLYRTDAAGYLDLARLHGEAGALLVIGHNPMTEELAIALTADRSGSAPSALAAGFPTAALAVIEAKAGLAELRPAGGRLEAFFTPGDATV